MSFYLAFGLLVAAGIIGVVLFVGSLSARHRYWGQQPHGFIQKYGLWIGLWIIALVLSLLFSLFPESGQLPESGPVHLNTYSPAFGAFVITNILAALFLFFSKEWNKPSHRDDHGEKAHAAQGDCGNLNCSIHGRHRCNPR